VHRVTKLLDRPTRHLLAAQIALAPLDRSKETARAQGSALDAGHTCGPPRRSGIIDELSEWPVTSSSSCPSACGSIDWGVMIPSGFAGKVSTGPGGGEGNICGRGWGDHLHGSVDREQRNARCEAEEAQGPPLLSAPAEAAAPGRSSSWFHLTSPAAGTGPP